MAAVPSMYNRYFVYSTEEATRFSKIYGNKATLGTVIVRGVPKQYTSIVSDMSTAPVDAIPVISGDIRKIKYTESTR